MDDFGKTLKSAERQAIAWARSPLGLGSLFAAGLVIRVWLAPQGGFPGDLLAFQHWDDQLANNDWSRFSDPPNFVYYPYLYILAVLGQLTRWVTGSAPSWTMLKIPPILADLSLAWVTGLLAQRLAPTSVEKVLPVRALAAAAILFNPAILLVSALWGQVDSIGALLVMGSLFFLATAQSRLHREAIAAVLLGLALGIKPQAGVILPFVVMILVRRHAPTGKDIGWREWARALARVGGLGVLVLAVVLAVPAPLGLNPLGAASYYAHSPTYAFTSANAFNLWGVLGFWVPDLRGPSAYTVLGIPAFWLGVGMFAIGTAAILILAWRALASGLSDGVVVVFGSAALTCLSFAVLTRVHERYLLLAIPCTAALVAQRPLRRALIALSALLLVNLYFPYVFFVELYGQTTFIKNDFIYGVLYGSEQDSFQKKLLSAVIAITCLAVAGLGWGWLGERAGAAGGWRRTLAGWWQGTAAWRRVLSREPREVAGEQPAEPWWRRFAPLGLVATACAFNLWVLSAEATPVHNANDSSYHFAMLRWARAKIDQGKLPLDGWYPNLGLGLAQFHHYQSLPHVIGAYVSVLVGATTTFYWTLYLLLALWPISVYLCVRLLGWDRWTAAAAAVVAPLLVSVSGYGYEDGSYTWRGYGTWSQLWGMWLLPLAWGLSWRAVKGVGSYALGALVVALTVAVHFVTGYLALLSIGVWALVTPSALLPRLRRAALVGLGAGMVGSWVIVPLIADSAYASNTQYERGTYFYDSYGAPKVLGWLLTGQVFDSGRLPVVSVLVALGLVVCLVRIRRDERARAVLGVWLLSLLLFFGRPTLGPLLKILPGSDDLPLHRYINGVHLGGIILAGIGAAWLGRWTFGWSRLHIARVRPAAAAAVVSVLGLAALYPAWSQISTINDQGATWISQQVEADATDGAELTSLVDRMKTLGPGRVYGGSSSNWGRGYTIGFVPMYAELQNYDVDTVGFWLRTESLSSDVETVFDERNPAQYDLFNVRYMILPAGQDPPVAASLIAQQGRHKLWQVPTSGYLEVVDAIGPPIVADRKNIGQQTGAFDESSQLTAHRHPMVAFNGAAAAPPTLAPGQIVTGPAGIVQLESSNPADGVYRGQVVANRVAVVMLKSTFEPRWRVTVDGVEVQPQMIAPDFVARTVSPGSHRIEFRYVPYPYYPELLALGLVTLVGLQFGIAAWTRIASGRSPLTTASRSHRPGS